MNPYFAEFLGTVIIILFGGGVVANLNLVKSKGFGSDWVNISLGWD